MEIIESHINDLFSSKSNLESELREHNQQVKSLFLTRLFTGNYNSTEIAKNVTSFDLKSLIDSWQVMTVCTLQIDNLEKNELETATLRKCLLL